MPECLYIAAAMQRAENSDDLANEIVQLKDSLKQADFKKREAELNLNKLRTEIVSLRANDKAWEDAGKVISFLHRVSSE